MCIQQILLLPLTLLPILTQAHTMKTQKIVTFRFVVGKLVVGEAKPSLLEVLHSKPVSPLCSLYHESEGK